MEAWIQSHNISLGRELCMVLRLLAAAVFGGLLGFERTRKMRAAGLRTYALVCVGAATAMTVGLSLSEHYGADPGRIPSQVISGIGFIGAGTIMMTGYHRVRGLTTAAGLWTSACLGLVFGSGNYFVGIAMFGIVMLAMVLGEKMQTRYLRKSECLRVYMLFDDAAYLRSFLIFLRTQCVDINEFEQVNALGDCVGATFVIRSRNRLPHAALLKLITEHEGVAFVEEI